MPQRRFRSFTEPSDPETLVKVADAATWAGRTPAALYVASKRGVLPAPVLHERRKHYRWADITAAYR